MHFIPWPQRLLHMGFSKHCSQDIDRNGYDKITLSFLLDVVKSLKPWNLVIWGAGVEPPQDEQKATLKMGKELRPC